MFPLGALNMPFGPQTNIAAVLVAIGHARYIILAIHVTFQVEETACCMFEESACYILAVACVLRVSCMCLSECAACERVYFATDSPPPRESLEQLMRARRSAGNLICGWGRQP